MQGAVWVAPSPCSAGHRSHSGRSSSIQSWHAISPPPKLVYLQIGTLVHVISAQNVGLGLRRDLARACTRVLAAPSDVIVGGGRAPYALEEPETFPDAQACPAARRSHRPAAPARPATSRHSILHRARSSDLRLVALFRQIWARQSPPSVTNRTPNASLRPSRRAECALAIRMIARSPVLGESGSNSVEWGGYQ